MADIEVAKCFDELSEYHSTMESLSYELAYWCSVLTDEHELNQMRDWIADQAIE